MKKPITRQIEIPEGIVCTYQDFKFACKKDTLEISREIRIPQVEVIIKDGTIILDCKKGNRNTYKIIMSFLAHIRNLFSGLQEPFVYHLETCNVHFPMSVKVEGDNVNINNFLGEKTPRVAKVLPEVKVEVKGQKITITSHNKEAAGQTAANLEKATKVKVRDRRIYQDGIFIVEKPRRKM